jgi:HlyD family type I secretion membrane fusion protein
VLQRTLIGAPVDGTVVALRFRTAGGVVRPGEPVLEIVPDNEELLIDARLSPMDIDVVRAGLPARVVLPAFQQRHLPQIEGRVRQVSPDALADPQTGQRFFAVRVEIDRDRLAGLEPPLELTPGMPAEVYITTGERTALDYLLGPLYDSLRRAGRES